MSKKTLPSYLWNVVSWKLSREFSLFNAEQRGWYRQLLDECWNNDDIGYLKAEEDELKELSGFNRSLERVKNRNLDLKVGLMELKSTIPSEMVTLVNDSLELVITVAQTQWVEDLEKQWSSVLKRFKHTERGWFNERLLQAKDHVDKLKDQRSDAGKASAKKRWGQKTFLETPQNDDNRNERYLSVTAPFEREDDEGGNEIITRDATINLNTKNLPLLSPSKTEGREKRSLLPVTWCPTEKRFEWLAVHFPTVPRDRWLEIVTTDFIPYWTDPLRSDAQKTQRGWDLAFVNRVKQLRDYGRLQRGFRYNATKSINEQASEELARLEAEESSLESASEDILPLLDPEED